ncbi:protein kinase [Vibrio astriarenae]|uniref:Protein kinase n=1 Tax=Vibrio astriarenae TaxID=1481923 RepID=A0A7Z2T5D9_9VIBR|nr:serine/threonine-protein kinase [Vibrio astriarenae]QIA64571.1 protein kinase [Vibrio astriarenae]
MIFSASQTQLFYSLIDQPSHIQRKTLERLAQLNPEQHQLIQSMLDSDQQHHITELLQHEAAQTCYHPENLVGKRIEKYRITQRLGQGGFGQVYLAHRDNQTFEQAVAIKVFEPWVCKVLSQSPMSAKPFQEAHLLARLNHPNIAKVFDGGFELFNGQNTIYIVLEYIEGTTLDKFVQTNALTRNECLDIAIQVCQALEHAHYHQILHADIKPSNIIITPEGKVKLIDFNIVHHLHQYRDSNTLSACSRQFASPEQVAGQPIDLKSDIYSLGKVIEHLCAHLPHREDIDQVIQLATALESSQRYSSATKLLTDIENVRNLRPIASRCHDKRYRFCKAIQRHPISGCLALCLAVAFFLLTLAIADKRQQTKWEERMVTEITYQLKQSLYDKSLHEEPITHDVLTHFYERVNGSNVIPKRIQQAVMDKVLQPYSQEEHQ